MTMPLPPSLLHPPLSHLVQVPAKGPIDTQGQSGHSSQKTLAHVADGHYAVRLTIYTDRSGSFNSYNTLTAMACRFSWLFVSLISMQLMSGIINKKKGDVIDLNVT